MTVKDFKTKSIIYCESYNDFHQDYIACDHEFRYHLFELESGGKQLRQVCTKCYYRDPKIIKQTPELLALAKNGLEKNFTNFYSARTVGEYDEIHTFMTELRGNQRKDMKNNYLEYMDSDLWKETREPVLIRDNYTCQICGSPANHVHHLNYAHFMNEYKFELVSLCESCHMKEYHSEEKKEFVEKIMNQKSIIRGYLNGNQLI